MRARCSPIQCKIQPAASISIAGVRKAAMRPKRAALGWSLFLLRRHKSGFKPSSFKDCKLVKLKVFQFHLALDGFCFENLFSTDWLAELHSSPV